MSARTIHGSFMARYEHHRMIEIRMLDDRISERQG